MRFGSHWQRVDSRIGFSRAGNRRLLHILCHFRHLVHRKRCVEVLLGTPVGSCHHLGSYHCLRRPNDGSDLRRCNPGYCGSRPLRYSVADLEFQNAQRSVQPNNAFLQEGNDQLSGKRLNISQDGSTRLQPRRFCRRSYLPPSGFN